MHGWTHLEACVYAWVDASRGVCVCMDGRISMCVSLRVCTKK